MHTEGIDGRPQIFLTFLTSKSGSPKKWFAIAHENRLNGVYVLLGFFDLGNGSD